MLGVEFASHGESNAVELAASSAVCSSSSAARRRSASARRSWSTRPRWTPPSPSTPRRWLRSAAPSARDRGCTRPEAEPRPARSSRWRRPSPHTFDGDLVAIEGFTHLISFAAGHEIIRQGRRDLTLARLTPDLVYDQMVAAGCAQAHLLVAREPGVGSLHAIRRAIESGALEIEEYSHFGMVGRYVAGAAHSPSTRSARMPGRTCRQPTRSSSGSHRRIPPMTRSRSSASTPT